MSSKHQTTASASLDGLFAALRDAQSPGEASRVEHAIWLRWMEWDDPQVNSWMLDGVRAMNEGRHPQALRAFDAIVAAAPDFAEGWNKRATVHWLVGDHEKSLRDIDRTLSLEPRHFGALSGLALIHEANGRVFEALDALERAGEIHPHLPHHADRVAQLTQQLGQAT